MTDPVIPMLDARLWAVQAQSRIIQPGNGEAVDVPSGQAVTLQEVILDQPAPDAAIYRFRFLAPAIARQGGTLDFEGSFPDMEHLCNNFALPQLTQPVPEKLQVIIAFSDMELPFGDTNPEVTQFFVAFSVKDGLCILEPF